jgi:hypothetical protein
MKPTRFTAVALLLLSAIATPVSAQTKVRFTLDWIPGATHGAFLIAQLQGYYKAEGLDVTIDRGKGSAEVVRQLAADVYDMGFPDINVVMDFNSKNPEQAFPVLMSGYEEAPAAIVTLSSSGITEPKQLNGKKLGSAPNDSTFKLFPIFARKTGIDVSTVEIQSIDPSLREVLLVQKKVDAIPGQIFNSLLELKAKGVAPADVKYFMYKDYGLPLYANSIAASPRFAEGIEGHGPRSRACGEGCACLRAAAQPGHRARSAARRAGLLHPHRYGAQEGFRRCRPRAARGQHHRHHRGLQIAAPTEAGGSLRSVLPAAREGSDDQLTPAGCREGLIDVVH